MASLIFSSHLLLLKDENFTGAMRGLIAAGAPADRAIISTAEGLIGIFENQENPYFREKGDDIRDIALRLYRRLFPESGMKISFENCIIVAADIVPSDILVFSAERASGVILISGGITSHTVILARSLEICRLSLPRFTRSLELPESSSALIDAETGNIFINPPPSVREPYEKRLRRPRRLT